MSRMYYKGMIVLCVAAVLGVFVGSASADTIYLYDFSRVTSGLNLVGQDNWVLEPGTTNLKVSSGAAGWSGNYVETTGAVLNAQAYRVNNAAWSFSVQKNLSFDYSVVLLGSSTVDTREFVGLSPTGSSSSPPVMFVAVYQKKLYWYVDLDEAKGQVDISPSMLLITGTGGTGIYRLGWEATAQGSDTYSFRPYYVNPVGTKVYHSEGPYVRTFDVSMWNAMYVREYTTTTGGVPRVDDIRISQIPEPGTLMLLATGLLGLLCYAWRKRK